MYPHPTNVLHSVSCTVHYVYRGLPPALYIISLLSKKQTLKQKVGSIPLIDYIHNVFVLRRAKIQIAENPSILGLGDLELHDRERRQTSGSRLDLLLQNDDQRYEVRLQLGATDESHIIRTIEY